MSHLVLSVQNVALAQGRSHGEISVFSQPTSFNINTLCQQLEQHGFAHVHELFSQELLTALYSEIKQLDEDFALQVAGVGRGDEHVVEKQVRRDKIHWLAEETLAQCQFKEQLEQLRLVLNYHLMLGLFESESHFAVYRKGDFYHKHRDSFRGAKNRILSMVLYLNPQWSAEQGGLLNIYDSDDSQQPSISVVPHWGNVVLFLSEEILHEVTPTEPNRYSIATWFRCNHENPLV